MLQWLVRDLDVSLILSKFSVLESLALLFFLYFTYAFTGKELSYKKKILFSIPFWPIIFLSLSSWSSYIVDAASCSMGYGTLYYYMYGVVVLYLCWSVSELIFFKRKNTDEKVKNQINIIAGGLIFLVMWLVGLVFFSNKMLENNEIIGDQLLLLIPIGFLIFVGLLTYAITKYQFLKIKLVSAHVLTYTIWLLIGSMFFFVSGVVVYVLVAFTLILAIYFGIVLIKFVKQENQRKEELQIMADRLAVANDQLRKLDNAKTEFISIASHQLRTPLTAVKGFLSLVLEGSFGEVSQPVHGALDKAYAATDRLIQLVEDLLNISRIEAGRMVYAFKEDDVRDLLRELHDNFILAARNKKLFLDLKPMSSNLPKINMDRAKLREVLSNVIDNALKYTDRGGVTIKAELIPENLKAARESKLPSTDKGEEIKGGVVRICVSDTGIGIPQEEMVYLFKKFSRGKDVSRLNAGGTGLGIYVAKSIMEAHKGRIWAESAGAGRGSAFVLELPIK